MYIIYNIRILYINIYVSGLLFRVYFIQVDLTFRAILYGTELFFSGGQWRCFFHAEQMSNCLLRVYRG